jgi:hypothetical protein
VPGIPPEIPRLNLSSSDRRWKLQAATRRLNLFWERVDDQDTLPPASFLRALPEIIRPFLEISSDLKPTRLAYILRRFAAAETPSKDLAHYFVRPELLTGPLNRPSDFELHAHKVYTPKGFEPVNSWIRWKTARLASNQAPGILVEQDLNTLAERPQQDGFSQDTVENFFSVASNEAESILAFYLSFPPNESSVVDAVRS